MADAESSRQPRLTVLVACGLISWLLYAGFCWLSRDFAEADVAERPLLTAVGILATAFLIYLVALRAAILADGHRDVASTILMFAAGFRITLLFTQPFQEVDIYRYIWDGEVVMSGVSPFRFTPRDVLTETVPADIPADLRKLRTLRESDPALQSVLENVHFKHLPTVYPPTSQAVFAAAAASTPGGADVTIRLTIMKAWILIFDFGTLCLVVSILRDIGRPVGWAVAYGWCPLILKEFANSGHLDSIAVFLTTLSVWCFLKGAYPREGKEKSGKPGTRRLIWWTTLAAAALGLAVGAKLYPIVLAPLLFVVAVRRGSWTAAIAASVIAGGLSAMLLLPMIDREQRNPQRKQAAPDERPNGPRVIAPPIPPGGVAVPAQTVGTNLDSDAHLSDGDPSRGIATFLSQWKMNDFLFLIAIENLTPRANSPPTLRPWFAITPESWRVRTVDSVREAMNREAHDRTETSDDIAEAEIPFLIARILTASVFLVLALWWSFRSGRDENPVWFLESIFLTLAWFWLLLPTLNPWYWIWAMPFLPFARGRAWLAMSGVVLAYYLRFWFEAHFAQQPVWRTPYIGATFFDFVVVWLEFGPWFLWLIGASAWRWVRNRR